MSSRREKMVTLVNSLFDIEKQMVEILFDVVPDEVKKHTRAARKEQLLALRAVLDSSIQRLEKGEKEEKKRPQKVKVD